MEKFNLSDNISFSASVKTARKLAGLTQKTMSETMEIPRRTIEEWERGIYFPPIYVQKLVLKELLHIANSEKKD